MRAMLKFKVWLIVSLLTGVHLLVAADPGGGPSRKAAIFVANRAEKTLDDKLAAFEDFISSRITEKG